MRAGCLVAAACQDAVDVTLPWSIEANRPALRGLFRLFQQQAGNEHRAEATGTAQTLLRLNPDDDHRVGSALEHLIHS
jgi:hypothetical protein